MESRKMLNNDKLIYLGYIGKAHGIKGDVCVKSLTQNPADIVKIALQDEAGSEVILKLRSTKPEFLVCSVAGVSDRNAAEALRGTKLYTTRSELPETEEAEYYIEDLRNLEVRDAGGKQTGRVIGVHNFGAGDIIEVVFEDGESEMYPFTNDFFPIVTKEWVVLTKLN